ncbi:ABC transporter permease [Flavonifractor hominis]|uniref:ABC transporter permease n=1 Tax=Flavonifractor hominis TaxID=3133178 RepID=A0ABV1ETR0_9FIRM
MNKGTLKLRAVLRNPMVVIGFILFFSMVLVAIFADQIAPHSYETYDLADKLMAPCAEFPLGTDQYGRCIFSRIVYGSRIGLGVGLVAVAIETVIGVALGILAGYFGKVLDKIIMFVTDMVWSIPPIVLAMAIVLVLGSSAMNVAIAVALVTWAQFTKIVRAKVQSIRELPYIDAARVYGESDLQIILRYILPNLLSTIIILASLALPSAILSTTSMGFLGLGAQQPQPDWGMILSDGIQYIQRAPWISIYPGVAIVWTVLGFNLTGEGFKSLLDPRLKV